MFLYMISVFCAVLPCADVIHSKGSMLTKVTSDLTAVEHEPSSLAYKTVTSATTLSGENYSSLEPHKTGRAYESNSRNTFLNQLLTPAQDQPFFDNDEAYFFSHPNPVVATKDGRLRGFVMKTINSRPFAAFQSIPFAEPPLGERRFRAPERNSPWRGVRDAIEPSPHCIQSDYMKQYAVHG